MLGIRARTRDETHKVKRKAKRANIESLGHAGAALRLAAKRSILKRKRPSRPGQPPHTQSLYLRRSIKYAVDKQRQLVVIGPDAAVIGEIGAVHEHGWPQQPRSTRGKSERELLASGTNWKLKVGGHGPIGDGRGNTVYIKFVSEAQVERSIAYIESGADVYATKAARERAMKRRAIAGRKAHYPKRPFMGPALQQIKPRLPRMWAASIR
jgi:hypothetical protein